MPINEVSLPKESLIAETMVVRLSLEPMEAVTDANPRSEADRIEAALQAISAVPDDTVVIFRGRAHKILKPHYANPSQGTQMVVRSGAKCAALIVLAPVDEPAHHISVRYALVSNWRESSGAT